MGLATALGDILLDVSDSADESTQQIVREVKLAVGYYMKDYYRDERTLGHSTFNTAKTSEHI